MAMGRRRLLFAATVHVLLLFHRRTYCETTMMRVVNAHATGITPVVVVSRVDGTVCGNNGDTGFIVPICAARARASSRGW